MRHDTAINLRLAAHLAAARSTSGSRLTFKMKIELKNCAIKLSNIYFTFAVLVSFSTFHWHVVSFEMNEEENGF